MIGPILRRAEAGRTPTRREVMLMLHAEGAEYQALLDTARRMCYKFKGEEPALRSLITLGLDCGPSEAVEEAVAAWRLGCTSVLIRTEGMSPGPKQMAGLVTEIKARTGLRVSLSMGERSYEAYAQWREAGAEEYVLPHECCHPLLYGSLYPGRSPAERLTRYLWLKGLGYRVTGGLRVGLPGQTPEVLADDVETLRNSDVTAVVLRPVNLSPEVLRVLAITRLCLPEADLWLATDDASLQSQALACGANLLVTSLPGVSPNVESVPFALAQAL